MSEELNFNEPEQEDSEDTTDVVFLTAENKDDLLSRFEKPYYFDAEPGRKREGFFVRMATLSVMQKFERLNNNKGSHDQQKFKALCELIADSVVDPSGAPIWSEDQIASMGSANVPRFMKLQAAVLDRNGLKKLDELIEEAAKN